MYIIERGGSAKSRLVMFAALGAGPYCPKEHDSTLAILTCERTEKSLLLDDKQGLSKAGQEAAP